METIQQLITLYQTAVAAAHPRHHLARYLGAPNQNGRTIVIGAGKAAAAMAQALEQHWHAHLEQIEGLVVTPYGHAAATRVIEVIEAAHPIPDKQGQRAARQILARVQGLRSQDRVVCLLSGGGSSLLGLPAPGLSLADKQQLSRQLLASGASIDEINCVRKHLSAIKGGRLGAACYPAQLQTLAISDVPGDKPEVIASGPTLANHSRPRDALDIIERYQLQPPVSILAHLNSAAARTPRPDLAVFTSATFQLIAKPSQGLEAAAKQALQLAWDVRRLGDSLAGEARELGAQQARQAMQLAAARCKRPQLLLSGGETTVTVKGQGRGGRNTEFLLGFAQQLMAEPELSGDIYGLAADTDGIDGSEDNAGAYWGPEFIELAREKGLNAAAFLQDNDSYHFFKALNALLISGPTRTNINDFRAVLVLPG